MTASKVNFHFSWATVNLKSPIYLYNFIRQIRIQHTAIMWKQAGPKK